MPTSMGKKLRLAEWISEAPTLIIDTTIASSIGPVGVLADLEGVMESIWQTTNGVIVNPGIAERLGKLTKPCRKALPLVRVDWTNQYRQTSFPLSPQEVHRVEIAKAEDVLELGGYAAVANFMLGFDEEFEAQNINYLSFLARDCSKLGLPLVIDVNISGPKVSLNNRIETIELAVGMMVECGADVLLIPYPGEKCLEMLLAYSPIPIIVKWEEERISVKTLEDIIAVGPAGVMLGAGFWRNEDPLDCIGQLAAGLSDLKEEGVTGNETR